MNQRNLTIDILKGVAIILVVTGHCIQYGTGDTYLKEELFFDNNIFKLIYSFHMPLFMLISGYLFNKTVCRYKIYEIFKSRITALLIPILFWSLILYISLILISKDGMSNIINDKIFLVKMIGKIFLYELWFLWAIFYNSIIVMSINKILKDNKLIYISIFIITFIIPDILGMALYKYMYPFFVIGYFFANYEDRINLILKDKKSNCMIIIFLGAIFIYLIQFYQRNSYIYTSGYYIFNKSNPTLQLKTNLYRMTIGLTGSILVILLIRNLKFQSKIMCGYIAYIGKKSLGIYIISNIFLNRILVKILSDVDKMNPNYIVTLIEVVLVIGISLGGIIIIKKIEIMNKLLLGGRDT